MNLPNVIGFFGMGFVMEVLPRFAMDAVGSETRLLWLTVMGAVMMMIGGAYLARMAWATLPHEKYHALVRDMVVAEKRVEQSGAEMGTETAPRA